MSRRMLMVCLTIILALCSLGGAKAQNTQLTLAVGESDLMPIEGIDKLVIGNPQVIQARILDSTQVLINGIGVGDTNLILWGKDVYAELWVTVREWDTQDVQDYCQYLLGEEINVTTVNGKTFVNGSVMQEPRKLEEQLKERFPGLAVHLTPKERFSPEAVEAALKSAFANPTIELATLGSEQYIVRGQAQTSDELKQLEQALDRFPGNFINLVKAPVLNPITTVPNSAEEVKHVLEELWPDLSVSQIDSCLIVRGYLTAEESSKLDQVLAANSAVRTISLVHTVEPLEADSQQIRVKLQLVEMRLEDLQELGFQWDDSIMWSADNKGGGPLQIGSWIRQTDLVSRLHLLSSHGKARILAEPELIALEGQEARVHVGGQIPVGGDESGVDWKDYGIELKIIPRTIQGEGIELSIQTEVSSLDWANAVETQDARIPAITTSSLSTILRQPSGTSTALGGLLEERKVRTKAGVPGLSSLPLLGGLFSWDKDETSERELVAVVTASIEPATGSEKSNEEDENNESDSRDGFTSQLGVQ